MVQGFLVQSDQWFLLVQKHRPPEKMLLLLFLLGYSRMKDVHGLVGTLGGRLRPEIRDTCQNPGSSPNTDVFTYGDPDPTLHLTPPTDYRWMNFQLLSVIRRRFFVVLKP